MKKLQYKINATFVLWPHLSLFSGLTSQSKQQENCIHLDVLSSPLVNAFCCQKRSGLVGNWGYISRRLLRSFWWPQLCYSGCKRRPEQLAVTACFMSPMWYNCLRSPMGRPLWGDTRELSGFDLFPLTLEEMAISSQLQHFRIVFDHRQDKAEYLHLLNTQECKD